MVADLDRPEKFVGMAHGIARHRLRSYGGFGYAYEDLVQDGMLGLVRRWGAFDPVLSSRSTWAYMVLYRSMQDALRRYTPGGRYHCSDVEVFSLESPAGEGRTWWDVVHGVRENEPWEDRILQADLRVVMGDVMSDLSVRERRILELRFVEDRTWAGVAREFGFTGAYAYVLGRDLIQRLGEDPRLGW